MSSRPTPPSDLAGRWLTRFFTSYLAGERAASPRTIVAYRDAIKLLLTWFRETERIPPEKLRLTDIDRRRVLRFLDWLETERNCGAATRNQRLAVIKSFCRYTAVEQPDHLDQVTQILAIRQKNTPAPELGHLTGDEVKALLAQPGTGSTLAVRDTVLLAVAYDTAARVQELCDLNVSDVRRQVTGRAAQGDERERLWARWRQIDRNLDAYAAHRSMKTAVVVLEPRLKS